MQLFKMTTELNAHFSMRLEALIFCSNDRVRIKLHQIRFFITRVTCFKRTNMQRPNTIKKITRHDLVAINEDVDLPSDFQNVK